MNNIIGKRLYWYVISGTLAVASIFAILFWGLNIGLDFKGGSILTLKFDGGYEVAVIKDIYHSQGVDSVIVQSTSDNRAIIRSNEINTQTKLQISQKISSQMGAYTEENYQQVGPTVSRSLTNRAIGSVFFASILIILYIAYSFRGVPKPASSWRFGVCAIAALLHDLLIVTGIAAIFGHFFGWPEVDGLFITALLTILGFSVHDTIVVFDRLREQLKRHPGEDFELLANRSIIQTLGRSINTSVTTLLVLLTLFILGGESVKGFVFTLLIGITIGTYSSIFNATPLLVSWQNRSQAGKRKLQVIDDR